jgi:hypothetical protein
MSGCRTCRSSHSPAGSKRAFKASPSLNEVLADRLRTVIKTLAGQLATQRDDPLRHRRGGGRGLEGGRRDRGSSVKATVAVSGESSVDVLT